MITLDLYELGKIVGNNKYGISRSSKVYEYLKNEYRNNKQEEYDYILEKLETREKNISLATEKIEKSEKSILVEVGTEAHTYFETEYYHTLPEDREHNIIIPKVLSYRKK